MTRRYRIAILTILTILSFSTFIPALAYAAPLAVSEKDWEYLNSNSWGQNNNPQTQINRENADQLELKWIFPIAGASEAPAFMKALNMAEGSTTPPIVKNGLVYLTSLSLRTFAINAKTGRLVWSYQYTVDIEKEKERLPIVPQYAHLHGMRYWAGQDVLLVPGLACDYVAIDAKTGKEKFKIGPYCQDVPGNVYPYYGWMMGMGTAVLGTYETGRLFIGGHGGTEPGNRKMGRGIVWAIGMEQPNTVVWRVFNQPPQDRPVDDWALQECDRGWFYTIPCSEVRDNAPQNLMNDWQMNPGQVPHWSTGATSMWGQPVVDEDTGLIYLNTGNVSPFFYTEYRPGPNLYSATIQAIDLSKGQRAWWVQDVPRDPWDYDCNWNGFLADDTTLGKVYVKGCKLGYLHVRDAVTGKSIQYIDTRAEGQHDPRQGVMRTDQLGVNAPLDPRDTRLMKEWVMRDDYPAPPSFPVAPDWLHGSFGSDISYNKGTIFHWTQNSYRVIDEWVWPKLPEVQEQEGISQAKTRASAVANATLVARDLVTGRVKWIYFYPATGVRGFVTVTGGIVIAPSPDGFMRFIDEENGKLLREVSLGGGMVTGSTVGKDSDGNSKIFALVGTGAPFGWVGRGSLTAAAPGTLVALGLAERPAAKTTTITSTTTTTTTSVTTTTATTTTTSVSTTTSTTTTVSPTTISSTVTLSTTQTVEAIGPVTYGAVAIAVIAIIAAAILATRRRPA